MAGCCKVTMPVFFFIFYFEPCRGFLNFTTELTNYGHNYGKFDTQFILNIFDRNYEFSF